MDLWLDAAAAHAQPPAGVATVDATVLGWIGGRLRLDGLGPLALDLSAYGGRSAESIGGAWLNGALGGETTRWIGSVLASGRLEVFGLDYHEPFAYAAYGFSLTPRLVRTVGPLTVTAHAELTRGRWRLDDAADSAASLGSTASAIRRVTDGPLGIAGGALTVGRALGPLWLEASGRAYEAHNGDADGRYAALGTSLAFTIGPADGRVGAARWSTPAGSEYGLNATLGLMLSERFIAHAHVEKTAMDPLYGSPGSVTASLGMSWRLAERQLSTAAPVVEIAEPAGRGRKVRFQLPAGKADRVALAGDFTGWAPRTMKRAGDLWVLELVIPPGLHHFVFLLDGDRWYVPDNAPGIVDDGWGRRNASVVVVQEK